MFKCQIPSSFSHCVQEDGSHDTEVVAGDSGDAVVPAQVQQVLVALQKERKEIKVKAFWKRARSCGAKKTFPDRKWCIFFSSSLMKKKLLVLLPPSSPVLYCTVNEDN